jgi:transcriptional regulator with XRE-family HTH domain
MSSSLHLFGESVRQLREERGWSQEELADRCHLHRTYVGGIERGERNVSLLNVLKLASALEVSPARLFEVYTSKQERHAGDKKDVEAP